MVSNLSLIYLLSVSGCRRVRNVQRYFVKWGDNSILYYSKMQYFISYQNAENGTYARIFHTMDEFCLRMKKTQEIHLPYNFLAALDLLFKVIEGRAGQN